MTETTIERVEVWCSSIPLPAPLVLGSVVIRHREFVIVRVRTRGGLDGVAYALSRGAATDLVISDCLGPLILGSDASEIEDLREHCSPAMITLGSTGIALRALSLLDVALWDIKAKQAGVPLWQLLGGQRRQIPVMLVAPHANPAEDDDDYAVRVAEQATGFTTIKLYPAADTAATSRRLWAIRSRLGPDIDLVLDMAWSWKTLEAGVASALAWKDLRLRWIEDPYAPDRIDLIGALKAAISTPVAAGDEVSAPWLIESLLTRRAVDVLRLDATTIGGISAVKLIAERAQELDCPISLHAYAEIHAHCALAMPGMLGVEVFPRNSPTWLADRLVRSPATRLTGGAREAPDLPGLGLEIDWEAVSFHAVRSNAVSS